MKVRADGSVARSHLLDALDRPRHYAEHPDELAFPPFAGVDIEKR
jgi:hypothetical protein